MHVQSGLFLPSLCFQIVPVDSPSIFLLFQVFKLPPGILDYVLVPLC
jgi:hypothetical protein